ncbi:exonuclease domain-containing protein [Rufibacter sediminis]|uniref:3'-5' exonuclease n=1 Tax=Rufibacter sediminis TaxID=2762756 RepID=A0ABR6VX70_9BACT|nr:3'-5' exonuclease [Rufibacter sediminis]MBC3541797.1 3'-5' exonuclease [Rufibacter sediminis]
MRDYLLFIDIEASGLPRNWDVPYAEEGNWPHTVQVAWLVYTKDGQLVKAQDHYIQPLDFEVSPSSIEIHSLTPEFLLAHGQSREEVLLKLQKDLEQYQPMVVGHFMQFDFHVLSADFYRAGLPSPFENLPVFCTMVASMELTHLPRKKYLRLGELYSNLFHTSLENQHNAVVDAQATAESYFELRKRRVITPASIAEQQENRYSTQKNPPVKRAYPLWIAAALGAILFILFLFYWL